MPPTVILLLTSIVATNIHILIYADKDNLNDTNANELITMPTTISPNDLELDPVNFSHVIQETPCPKGLTFARHFLGTPFCYVLTQKQRYPPACPYQNFLDYETIREISELYKNQSIWLRAKRDEENGFGQFEWLDPSNRYKMSIKNYESPGNDVMNKSCMIRKLDKNVPVLCEEEYPVLCIYSYGTSSIGKYCSKRNKFSRCISTNLDLDNQCYCLAHVEGMEISRTDFCEKLAEPVDPFQNHLLLNELTNKFPCWFGLLKNAKGEFVWESLKHPTNYTYWKDSVNIDNRFPAFDYIKPKGWILQNDFSLSCAVCETRVDYQNVTIRLKHVPRLDQIEVSIQNVFDVHNYFILQYILACFTDSNVDGLKMKIVSVVTDLLPIKEQYYIKLIKVQNYYPSYYWCETFQRPNLTLVVSNKILAYKDIGRHRHEYALIVKVHISKGIDPYLVDLHTKAAKFVNKTLHNQTSIINTVRPMKVLTLSQIGEYMELLLHISSTKNSLTSEQEYRLIESILKRSPRTTSSIILETTKFSRSDLCLANITKSGNMTLHWPETNVGVTIVPKELCLLRNSTPVVRTCKGNFLYGAEWGKVEGECNNEVNISQTTITLYKLLSSEEPTANLSCSLHNITTTAKNVQLIDVHFMTEILEKLTTDYGINMTEVTLTFNNIMEFNRSVLKEAQIKLNSTDRTLHVLDKICSNINKLSEKGNFFYAETKRLLIQISDINETGIIGAAIKTGNSFKENPSMMPLYTNSSIKDTFKDKDVDIAVLLPQEYIFNVHKCLEENSYPNTRLIIAFFDKDGLFNEVAQNPKQYVKNGRVIGVFLSGVCGFNGQIDIIYKISETKTQSDCAHWKYGSNELKENIRGDWMVDAYPGGIENKYIVCRYKHTTHYALLMYKENKIDEISPQDVFALNIITAIGCGLSLVGLAGIFVTAAAFKKWRRRTQNIIMLNFSFSLAAQMTLLFVANKLTDDSLLCLISGASLHYAILSEFAWMLIIAVLQYRKFVLVFQKPIAYLVLKCIIVGWFLPLIPVVIILSICPQTYEQNSEGLCYPKDKYFLYGLALPVGIIVLVNLFVFLKIVLNVCNRKVEAYGHKDNDTKLQVLLAILLFFLLGMSWIFGLATVFVPWITLSYLFCLTATLQGFIVFLFFVIMNKQSRLLWLNIKKVFFQLNAPQHF